MKIAEAVSQNVPFIAIKEALTDDDMKNGKNCICVSTFEEMGAGAVAVGASKDEREENARTMMKKKYSLKYNQEKLIRSLK